MRKYWPIGNLLIQPQFPSQWRPADHDGIRRRGSHLHIELVAPLPYRSFPVPVRPVCSITRVVACSPLKRVFLRFHGRYFVGPTRSHGLPGFGSPCLAVSEYCPDGSSQLVGDCRHCDTVRPAFQQFGQPRPLDGSIRSDDSSGAMHQKGSQVRITSFADTELAYFPARAGLTRDQTNPVRRLSLIHI